MKTPTTYKNSLKEHIITWDMLSNCLYSASRRADNYRLKDKYSRRNLDIWYSWLCYINGINMIEVINQLSKREKLYYSYKKVLLSFMKPSCIHEELITDKDGNNCNIYYLFYEVGDGRTYWVPVKNPADYQLPIEPLIQNPIHGAAIGDLVSMQFIRKMINLIESGDYCLILEDGTVIDNRKNQSTAE